MAILIVEDEQGIVSFVRRGLESAGYTVVVASDGVDGLAMAMLPDVELVILDLGLPGIPGEEVLRRLRAQRPTVPVIVLTAKDSVTDRVSNLEAGADDYLMKPFSFSSCLPGCALACGHQGSRARTPLRLGILCSIWGPGRFQWRSRL